MAPREYGNSVFLPGSMLQRLYCLQAYCDMLWFFLRKGRTRGLFGHLPDSRGLRTEVRRVPLAPCEASIHSITSLL